MPTIRVEGMPLTVPFLVIDPLRKKLEKQVAKLYGKKPENVSVLFVRSLLGSSPDVVVHITGTFSTLVDCQKTAELVRDIVKPVLDEHMPRYRNLKVFCDVQKQGVYRGYTSHTRS